MTKNLESRTEAEKKETLRQIEIPYNSHSSKKYHLIPVHSGYKDFWEAENTDFLFKLDTGNIITHSTGQYIAQGLHPWFKKHSRELKLGKTVLVVEKIDDLEYRMYIKR